MNFSYLYLDEKSLSYGNLLEKIMLSGDHKNARPEDYENFRGYDDSAKSDYYDVGKKQEKIKEKNKKKKILFIN